MHKPIPPHIAASHLKFFNFNKIKSSSKDYAYFCDRELSGCVKCRAQSVCRTEDECVEEAMLESYIDDFLMDDVDFAGIEYMEF